MRWYVIAAPFLFASSVQAQGIVLDSFDTLPNGQAGGPREVSAFMGLNPFGQPSSFDVFTGFQFGTMNGAAIFNSGIGVEQLGIMNWDNNNFGLNMDAVAQGITGFELDFLQIDQAFDLVITLQTFGFNPDDKARLTATIGPAFGMTTYFFSIDDFVKSPNSGFAFGKVDSITIDFNTRANPTASLDFILTEFRATVPSPGGVGLLGLGGLVAMRRRR